MIDLERFYHLEQEFGYGVPNQKTMKTELSDNANKPVYPDPMRGAEQSYVNQSPHELNQGLTKRELFAMSAMQAMVQFGSWDIKDEIARRAVGYADELLKALDK